MKILMVSMFSPHFFNWTNQLSDSGHEVYWLDVFDSNTQVEKIDFVNQITGWRNKINYPGRYKVKSKWPLMYDFFNKFNQRKLVDVFENKLKEIKPDVVHSFVMYSSCVPILQVMRKYPEIKWIYSAWGNDLFYYQHKPKYFHGIKAVMPSLNYMFADCRRDYEIAKKHGFKGEYLGTFPTGGGYDFSCYNPFIKKFRERNIILIKGYQHKFGRCNKILEAVSKVSENKNYNVVVFGANIAVYDFVKSSNSSQKIKNLKILGQTSHTEVLKLMGESVLYIGNSISDGMPNTLLEAIIMEAFPIQSNPGGATAEIIVDEKNGFLIKNPENSDEIAGLIKKALESPKLLQSGIDFNNKYIKPKLERGHIKKHMLEKYKLVEQNLICK